MPIVKTINEDEFVQGFDKMNRAENFTFKARRFLFDYYDQLSDDCGNIEYDVIAICCDWTEYTAEELFECYGDGTTQYSEEVLQDLLQSLECDTTVIVVDHYRGEDTYLVSCY